MNNNKGFTLIELLVAVAVFGIMITLAAPNLAEFTTRNRLVSQTNILVAHLNLARSEAVKRNRGISVCVSNPAHSACLTGSQWEDGWLIFIDANADDDFDAADNDILLQVGDALKGGNTIRSDEYTDIFTYQNDGSISAAGTFKVCDQDATLNRARAINISVAGHISIGDDSDDDGIPEDFANNELTSCT